MNILDKWIFNSIDFNLRHYSPLEYSRVTSSIRYKQAHSKPFTFKFTDSRGNRIVTTFSGDKYTNN
jgi:hypothetical protein